MNGAIAWSPEALERLRAQDQVVFVNMTADWCVTWKGNEKRVLDTDAFRQTLAAHEAVYMKGDWTNVDPEITAFLQEHGAVGDRAVGARHRDLDHRDFAARGLRPALVEQPRRLVHQQLGLFEFDARQRDIILNVGVFADHPAEGAARHRPLAHQLDQHVAAAEAAHTVMDARNAEPRLADGEALALLTEQVRARNADILQHQFDRRTGRLGPLRIGSVRTILRPGASIGTSTIECFAALEPSASVTPTTTMSLQSGCVEPEVNHLRPLMT